MSLSSHGNLLRTLLGTYSLNSSLLGYSIFVLTIIGNQFVMIWVLSIKEAVMPWSARLIREMGLRCFLHCYAVAGYLLQNLMVSHIVILWSRNYDRTTRETTTLTRNTSTWW